MGLVALPALCQKRPDGLSLPCHHPGPADGPCHCVAQQPPPVHLILGQAPCPLAQCWWQQRLQG
eukprot:8108495-Lingulodinium_polyedra.AAC.1